MTMVRFATTCDRCGARSEEYTAWPSCRECLNDICPDCAYPNTLVDADLDQPATVECRACFPTEIDTTWPDYTGGGR